MRSQSRPCNVTTVNQVMRLRTAIYFCFLLHGKGRIEYDLFSFESGSLRTHFEVSMLQSLPFSQITNGQKLIEKNFHVNIPFEVDRVSHQPR